MMRRNVATTPTARACQIASLLLTLMMVLGVLVQDILRGAGTTAAQREPTRRDAVTLAAGCQPSSPRQSSECHDHQRC